MRDYELTVVISPSVADDEVTATLEKKVSQLITERGGSITEVKPWGRKKLAYPIKNYTEGNYVLTLFKMDPKLTAELESSLELSEEILRHLLVRLSD
ncbi:MAG: 30S ribosomal protein S6 [Dehalococcoidia bacterium]|nr:30S ribosomal protein S6 [Dehalococcoidia bacterium]